MNILDGVEVISTEGKKANEVSQFGVKVGSIGIIHKISTADGRYYIAFNYPTTARNTDPDCVWLEPHQIKLFERRK